jgi:hypothetical protein
MPLEIIVYESGSLRPVQEEIAILRLQNIFKSAGFRTRKTKDCTYLAVKDPITDIVVTYKAL